MTASDNLARTISASTNEISSSDVFRARTAFFHIEKHMDEVLKHAEVLGPFLQHHGIEEVETIIGHSLAKYSFIIEAVNSQAQEMEEA